MDDSNTHENIVTTQEHQNYGSSMDQQALVDAGII